MSKTSRSSSDFRTIVVGASGLFSSRVHLPVFLPSPVILCCAMGDAGHHTHRTVQLIGCFRLFKALLLFAIVICGCKLLHRNIEAVLTSVAHHLNLDTDGRFFQVVLDKVWHAGPKLPLFLTGSAAYGLLFCVEGVGLLRQRRWAEYLTVIITSSFLPIEIYEMIKHGTWVKAVVIAINAAIVVYLIVRLRKDRAAPA